MYVHSCVSLPESRSYSQRKCKSDKKSSRPTHKHARTMAITNESIHYEAPLRAQAACAVQKSHQAVRVDPRQESAFQSILCRLTEGLSTKHILPSAENAAHLTIPWLPQMKMIKGQDHPVFWLNCNDDSWFTIDSPIRKKIMLRFDDSKQFPSRSPKSTSFPRTTRAARSPLGPKGALWAKAVRQPNYSGARSELSKREHWYNTQLFVKPWSHTQFKISPKHSLWT